MAQTSEEELLYGRSKPHAGRRWQERFWLKPTQHMYLVLAILAACLPFFSVGITSRFFPSYLEYFPKPYLQVLCVLSNAVPKVKDYYSVLGVSPDSDMKTIKRVFREMAIELHPDKVGETLPLSCKPPPRVPEGSTPG
jgi:DnaJ-domain-containing protein 1